MSISAMGASPARVARLVLAVAGLLVLPPTYPVRAVCLINPFPPGGAVVSSRQVIEQGRLRNVDLDATMPDLGAEDLGHKGRDGEVLSSRLSF